jgi:putative ABC transport system permease protein
VSFVSLIVRNLVRHRTRTLLTVLGIGIGITTVIALGAVTSGLKASSEEMAHAGGADFMVAQKGAADLTFSSLPASDEAVISGVDGVDRAWGVLLLVSRAGSNPFFLTWGIDPADADLLGLQLATGHLPRGSAEIALGQEAASSLGAAPGDVVEIERVTFRVVGVYESTSKYEAAGGYATLQTVREAARKPKVLTAVYVVAEQGQDVPELMDRIGSMSETYATISTADDYAQVDQGMKMLDAANLAISLLAVVIGAIGVMNTMIMSVFERTREIGILRAVGWRGSRVVRMVIGESLILCVIGAVLGTALGLAATRLVMLIPAVGSFLEPTYPAGLFVRALVIAVGVALVGALYPALRAVRLSPMEALRYE